MQEVREEEGIIDAAEERPRDQEARAMTQAVEVMDRLIHQPPNVMVDRLVLGVDVVEDVVDAGAAKDEDEAVNLTDTAGRTVTRRKKSIKAGVLTKVPPSLKAKLGAQ